MTRYLQRISRWALGGLAKLAGGLLLTLAAAAMLTAMSLLVLSTFALTFPLLRLSPRNRRVRAAAQLLSALLVAMQAFSPEGPFGDDA